MYRKPLRVFVIENEEIYTFIYESMSEGHLIDLVGLTRDVNVEMMGHSLSSCWPDVILRGVSRPSRSDFEELARLRQMHPGTGIVLLLGAYDKQDIDTLREIAVRSEGGLAVSLRQSLHRTEQLLGIINAAASGQTILDPLVANLMLTPVAESPYLKQLTSREKEILRLLSMGYTNYSIGQALFIDIKTVEHHLNNVYSKLRTGPDFGDKHPRVAAAVLYLKEAREDVACR